MAARKAKTAVRRGSFRIIGGSWRGRRLGFVDDGSVRPTPDRIRETLFNWLADDIQGARCVDLFAGSGALGLEALSRGAAEVSFVDTQPVVLARIRDHLQTLQSQAATACMPAERFLAQAVGPFDIAFVDPPYGCGLVPSTLSVLAPRLAPCNLVYMECERGYVPGLPAGWDVLRAKQAGQVSYHLLSYTLSNPEAAHG